MNFDLEKLFIGLIDFFSIVLPGALLTYLIRDDLGPWLLGNNAYSQLASTEGVPAFLFSSYLLGHFIFLVGSGILDSVYDRIRDATADRQITRLAAGKGLSPRCLRRLAQWLFKKDVDKSVDGAVRIKEHYLGPLDASSTINAFQWAKVRLTIDAPAAMAGVQRFEADSKFFRSLVVVLIILIPWALLTTPARTAIAMTSAPMVLLAFWRYVDQRSKSTNQAYWYIIAIEAANEKGFRVQTPVNLAPDLTHAGGVVFRRRRGNPIEYLLVQASGAPEEWVLPKGHIEHEESPPYTAVREVHEETGVWAAIRGDLRRVSYTAKGEEVRAQFYLMEALAADKAVDKGRSIAWLPIEQAVKQTRHDETRALLSRAAQSR